MIDNEVVTRIAQKIKSTRLQKGLTIQQVSSQSKVSKGLLSKIENSRTIPSLPVFVSLIHSLNISLKEFFEDMLLLNGKDYWHIKNNEYADIKKEGRPGFRYHHILSQTIPTCTMEAVILTLEPGAAVKATTSDGYEFKHMLKGNCEYHFQDTIIEFEEGDSLYFDASKPHVPVNKSNDNVTMLVIYFLVS
jgi:transcriptional regulator with XRE-family HTH domain